MKKKAICFLFVFMNIFLAGSIVCAGQNNPKVGAEGKKQGRPVKAEYPYAKDFKLKDINDKEAVLSSYKDKQPVILFFWTSWCPYCRNELKTLQSEYNSLSSDGVALLAVNVGEQKSKVENFIKSKNLSFRVLLDTESQVADEYDLLGVPTYFVINKSGQVVFSGNHFPEGKIKDLISK